MDGEKLNVFSSVVAVFQTFSMLARGEDFVGAVGVGGGGIRFAFREVRRGDGVCGTYEKDSGDVGEVWWGVKYEVVLDGADVKKKYDGEDIIKIAECDGKEVLR